MRERSEPEWTIKNQTMEQGATTFKSCGWCQHRGGGSYRYNCMLDGSCKLLKSYDNDVQWNTPCVIITLGGKDLLDIIESKKHDISEAEGTIKSTKSEIETIKKTMNTEWFKMHNAIRPALPKSRRYDHFELGAPVYVYFQPKDATAKADWFRGKVVKGYRHHDGCVSFVFDDATLDGGGSGTARPEILLEKEFKFLKNAENAFITEQWFRHAYKGVDEYTADAQNKLMSWDERHKK